MSEAIENALAVLKKAMQEDPDYAHSWHCVIACMCADAIPADMATLDVAHSISNDAASRAMKLCFAVETTA